MRTKLTKPDVVLQLVKPYWVVNEEKGRPRKALAGVAALTLLATGVSVTFNFLGRDFFNALSAKDEATFYSKLVQYLGGFAVGIPVFIFRDYFVVRPGLQASLPGPCVACTARMA